MKLSVDPAVFSVSTMDAASVPVAGVRTLCDCEMDAEDDSRGDIMGGSDWGTVDSEMFKPVENNAVGDAGPAVFSDDRDTLRLGMSMS